ncbi:hypothetical protein PAPYR_1885 [Paratrimastix pyriformis]|uniref:Uncharacterized protein n=1 Tax=Paratrimastix pyriformis TaxID=342808 RepID=A0ABQ8UTT0_9EUKA|nr:hypothetical protein PAPYR_1885 [Paratrimastix pyriformis]
MHLSLICVSPILDPRCYFSAVSPPYITPPHHPTGLRHPDTRSPPSMIHGPQMTSQACSLVVLDLIP